MTLFWLPETTPPQVSDVAVDTVLSRVLQEGVIATSKAALQTLEADEENLAGYLDRFGFDANAISDEGYWPERVLKIGASLTLLAYRESGYTQTISDERLAVSAALANLEGVPEAYFSSYWQDAGLQSLISSVGDADSFQGPLVESAGYHQLLDMGAGCVRFYLQGAVAA
jgi:hypothetical protein